MKTNLLYVFLIFVILFASCGSNSKSNSVSASHFGIDMDQQFAWIDSPLPNLIIDNNAHSGRVVCKLDSITPYSPTFNLKKSDMVNQEFKEIKVSGYFFIKNTAAKPMFVVELKDSTNQFIELNSQDFGNGKTNLNEWVYCEYTLSLKENNRFKKTGVYRIYGHNPRAESVLLDDISIDFN